MQKIAEARGLFFLFRRVPQKFDTVFIAFTVPDNSADANRLARIRRREFHKDLIAVLEFDSGKNEQATLADVAATAIHDRGLLTMHDQTQREIESESLPASLYGFFVCQMTSIVDCHDGMIEPLFRRWKLQKCMVRDRGIHARTPFQNAHID